MMENTIATIIGILGIFGGIITIEKLPLKIYPLKWIKKFLYNDLEVKVDKINDTIGECKAEICCVNGKVDKNEIDRIKQEILTFRLLVKTENINIKCLDFDHIFILYDKYKSMGGNSVVDLAIEEIKIIYKEFLKWF